MRQHTLLVLLLAGAGCAAPATVPAPGFGYSVPEMSMAIVESPHTVQPVDDISEAERREWYETHRPKVEPAPVDRLAVDESATYCHDRWYDPGCWGGWLLPFSLSLGYWGGHGGGHCGGGGWGVGLGFGGGGCGWGW